MKEDPIKKKVGITKYMTKEERQEISKLLMALKEKRNNGEQGWYIKNGKLNRAEGAIAR